MGNNCHDVTYQQNVAEFGAVTNWSREHEVST